MTERRTRFALAGIVFAVLFAQVLLYPGIDALVAALGADAALSGSMWFLAAEFAAFVAFAGVWGAASDAVGRRAPLIAIGAIGGAAGYAILAAIPRLGGAGFLAILGLRVLQGASTIGAFSLAMTMLLDLEGGQGKNMGAAGIAIGSGTALGAPLGGQLYEIGPLVPLIAAAGLLAAVAVAALLVEDRAPGSREGVGAILSSVTDRPALVVPYAFGFIDRFTAGFFALVGTLYFRTAFGLSAGATGLMLALFFAPFALFQYPFGTLSDRIGRTVPVVLGSVCYGLVVIAVGLAPTVELAGAAMVAVGVVGALMAPATMALVGDLAPPDRRGVAMAGFNVFGSVGFLAGILGGGAVADAYGFTAAFGVAGATELLVALVTLPVFLRLRLPRPAAE
ncbi:MFS transporter [Halomicrobium salinisoli]|uniref:MFS transporter n=1 Tax=Halomicrobium salinisoli TaxID=2878391 RepID=UPI001CF0A15F|nr:MFS transporter [Halomicrobium salinisoli]